MTELERHESKNKALRAERDEAQTERQKLKSANNKLASELQESEKKKETALQRYDDFKTQVAVRESPARRLVVDISGGTTAFSLSAGLNALFRLIGRRFPNSWRARNIDWIQGAPHFVLGTLIYGVDLYGRSVKRAKDARYLPSGWREGLGEAAKVFAELGASNVLRAVRVRLADGKDNARDLEAENTALKAQIQALSKQITG